MKLLWTSDAWKDYLYWQSTDKRIMKRVNKLIKSALRNPFSGIGKPEPLKHDLQGYWSRRIDDEHRLVYRVRNEAIEIISCRHHY